MSALFSQCKNYRYWLRSITDEYKDIVCGWGKHATQKRVNEFLEIAVKNNCNLMCLGTNSDGSPKHPSRIGYESKLIPFKTDDLKKIEDLYSGFPEEELQEA